MRRIMAPKAAIAPKRKRFRVMRKYAAFAEAQKGLPNKAIWMYAFLLMYLTNFSKTHTQHCKTRNTTTKQRFFRAAAWRCKNSRMYLMNWTSATMNDPKAIEPKWYRNIVCTACRTTCGDRVRPKNQAPVAKAMRHCPMATLKLLFHKKTKKDAAMRGSTAYRGGAHRQQRGSPSGPVSQAVSFQTKPMGHLSVHAPGVPWHSALRSNGPQVDGVPYASS
mmetsp:Transcript_22574/g.65054  ORF Transcript_22574/g.65054 Transcript_22574/m.65054 type:complete len:220 (+) Transcript_22574:488-1147(+)